ncbi:hypothetical protein [Agreia sp. Leaf283]|uniref:hypothetical protein n=1 Tax=Agreia sp. Leaf283 TaxID=1736321 RepID=UPI0012F9562E|nr:hypothetical protein [Agreia sp. Leaf283]
MDLESIDKVVGEAIQSIRAMNHEPYRGFKEVWPAGSCEWTSIGIAELLLHRGLGEWTYVQASRPGQASGHAWLELRDDCGGVRYSIDATLHQFVHHDSPYVGPGRTPAAAEFTSINYEGNWRDWPVLLRNETFLPFAVATLQHVEGAAARDA